jgi:hypothetical protein
MRPISSLSDAGSALPCAVSWILWANGGEAKEAIVTSGSRRLVRFVASRFGRELLAPPMSKLGLALQSVEPRFDADVCAHPLTGFSQRALRFVVACAKAPPLGL